MSNSPTVRQSPSKIEDLNSSNTQNVSTNLSTNDISSCIEGYSDSDDSSSDGMEIVITDSPKRKTEINLEDKKVLENIEEEIDKQLDEKAAKSNLTATNVKNILKHVISNEHVLAMVRHTVEEGDSTDEETFVYEPKLTRAKAKELYEKKNVINPWVKPLPKAPSEVHVLINQELLEDSDDDEYVPNECESEDDRISDLDSQPSTPQTPLSQQDTGTQTNWTDDGMFKIPDTPTQKEDTENIALRTRSKLSLSDTPLEKIEEAFIPPDITTDMYDLECDDEDWKEFLNKFTKPLDEAVQGQQEDDEETDPEYNVLADEEIGIVDTEELHEELREDKAVKVTKKELSNLVAELFDYSELFLMDEQNIPNDSYLNDSTTQVEGQTETTNTGKNNKNTIDVESVQPSMTYEQRQLLDQQLRQHVQLTTQHFLQTYEHPEYGCMAKTFKDFLLALHELGKYKPTSAFHIINLPEAIELISNWIHMHDNDDPDFIEMLDFVQNEIDKARRLFPSKRKNRHELYFVKHAPLYLKIVSNSCVFIYPELLPHMPFRCDDNNPKQHYISSENRLIALGLEQFQTYVEEDKHHLTKFGKIRLYDAAFFISKYVMPHKDAQKLYQHIKGMNEKASPQNPIKFFLQNKRAPSVIQYVTTLNSLGILPPCKRPLDKLPKQWRLYNFPNKRKKVKLGCKPERNRKKSTKKDNVLELPPVQTLGDHWLLQDKNSPNIFNLVPIRQNNLSIIQNKIPIPKINNINNKNKRKLSSLDEEVDDVNKRSKIKNSDSSSTNKVPVTIKYEYCDDIDIEETDLSSIKLENSEYCVKNTNSKKLYNIALLHQKRLNELIKIIQIFINKDFVSHLKGFQFNSSIFSLIKKQNHIELQLLNLKNKNNMLPSMPFLLTPSKNYQNNEESESPEKEKEVDKEKIDEAEPTEISDSLEEVTSNKKDNEDELNALMVASSTIQKSKKLPPTSTEKRKLKIQREYNATLAMLSPENSNLEEDKASNFAQAYFDKVHERLESEDPYKYQKFMETLNEYDSTKSITELWDKINNILSNHPDLSEEFLTFLTPTQANEIGKLVPHFLMSNMSLFLRKLEIYFNNQPAQLRKIYNSLTELANTPDIKIEQVRSTILPLLKGNTLLVDWFLQMFPSESPPESLMNIWETIQCDDETFDDENEPYETITLPETEDPYGGPNCICNCHKNDDEMYASRVRHCIPCGTKFLQGRVYVQTGKGLRLANVTFNNSPDTDHNKRLSAKPILRQKRKSETSPSKTQVSPTKEEITNQSNESEDDINLEQNKTGKKIIKHSPKTKKRNRPSVKNRRVKTPKENVARRIIKPKMKKNDQNEHSLSDTTKEISVESGNVKNITPKIETQESDVEWEKSPIESVESADTCEESSQDTINAPVSPNSDSDISVIESVSDNSEDSSQEHDESSWTRHEDKIILQMFKEYGDGEHIYKNIQQVLSNRSAAEIRQRFRLLLSLLQEMSHTSVL